jgi:exosortase
MSQVEHAPPMTGALTHELRRTTSWQLSGIWAAVVGVVVLAAYTPMLALHCYNLWDTPLAFYPLVPVGAFILVRERLPGLGHLEPGSKFAFALLMGLGMLVAAAAIAVFSPWMGVVAFLVTLLGVVYGVGGLRLTWQMLPVWLFLWFVVPLPMGLDKQLIASLQRQTARWSSVLLDTPVIGILHTMSGNAVEIPGQRLMVEEACSGVQSLFACMASAVFFVLWTRPALARGVLLIASSLGWVLISNALRVVLITWLTVRGYSVTEGLAHELLGIGVFVFTLLMIISTDRLFMFFIPPRASSWNRARAARNSLQHRARLPFWRETGLASWPSFPLVLGYVVLAAGQIYLLWPNHTVAAAPSGFVPATIEKLTADELPQQWKDWQRIEFSTHARPFLIGKLTSRYWAYRLGRRTVYVSIDYPFVDWHNLLICYRGVGWQVGAETYHPPGGETQTPFFEVDLNKADLAKAYLLYHLFDEKGHPLEPESTFTQKLKSRVMDVRKNWSSAGAQMISGENNEYFQIQVFIDGFTPITDTEREQAREFFQSFSRDLLIKFRPPSAGKF